MRTNATLRMTVPLVGVDAAENAVGDLDGFQRLVAVDTGAELVEVAIRERRQFCGERVTQ